ncbi:MAG: branched-chain amino acid transporter substrate-binding protein [Rhizobacter sp.]|nr:branched-chain amino acid transporter substrate-binding protein [Rhizobacter sp.]
MSLHDVDAESKPSNEEVSLPRRKLIAAGVAGGAAAAIGLPGAALAQSKTIKIGYLTTMSGVRANFGEADAWGLERIRTALKDGLTIGGANYKVDIVVRDMQSDANRGATLASELVLREKVDLLLVQDSDAALSAGQLCDVNGVPMISTMGPWQAVVFGRGSTPDKGFPYSFHFFWGADDVLKNFFGMWNTVKVDKTLGTLYIDNGPGHAFADPANGIPAGAKKEGYKEVSGGFFKMATDDFSNQVSSFKAGNVKVVSGFAYANHFATFWKQAQQSDFKPEVVTMAAAFLFPSAVESLGAAGNGMSTEVWWTPAFPYKSSITGESAKQLADAWEKSTGKQWTQPIGYGHALFEVGIAALKQSTNPKDKKAVRDSIANLDMESIVGPVKFKGSPIKSVAVTQMAAGQWRKTTSGKFPYELVITYNGTAPKIPVQDGLKLISQLK